MTRLFVPLQYLFLRHRAETFIAKAAAAGGTSKHARYLMKATKAVAAVEVMQQRFPTITNGIDLRRNERALRFEIRK